MFKTEQADWQAKARQQETFGKLGTAAYFRKCVFCLDVVIDELS